MVVRAEFSFQHGELAVDRFVRAVERVHGPNDPQLLEESPRFGKSGRPMFWQEQLVVAYQTIRCRTYVFRNSADVLDVICEPRDDRLDRAFQSVVEEIRALLLEQTGCCEVRQLIQIDNELNLTIRTGRIGLRSQLRRPEFVGPIAIATATVVFVALNLVFWLDGVEATAMARGAFAPVVAGVLAFGLAVRNSWRGEIRWE